MKKSIISLSTLGLVSLITGSSASALTYQEGVGVDFTIQNTITISLSSPNLVIDDLTPGTAADSNIVTVNVQSNNPRGYTLNSTVGDSTYTNRNLIHASSSSASPFSSIDYGTTIPTLNDLNPNQWGYSFSLDDGTTWINSNKTGNVNDTGYSGLPLYNDEEHITTLKESSATTPASGDNVKFKITAKASAAQTSGDYQNIINFVAIGAPAPDYIQDLTLAQCQAKASSAPLTVIDRRDGSDYTVRYINHNCWMNQNLRITGTISATDSNFEGADFNTKVNDLTSGNSYTEARSHLPTDAEISASGLTAKQLGAWYNYCAASAGEVCSQTQMDATQDICPAGWSLPTTNQQSSIISYNSWFLPIASGWYRDGSLYQAATYGRWWSATARDADAQHHLYYFGSLNLSSINKNYGLTIRCVRST